MSNISIKPFTFHLTPWIIKRMTDSNSTTPKTCQGCFKEHFHPTFKTCETCRVKIEHFVRTVYTLTCVFSCFFRNKTDLGASRDQEAVLHCLFYSLAGDKLDFILRLLISRSLDGLPKCCIWLIVHIQELKSRKKSASPKLSGGCRLAFFKAKPRSVERSIHHWSLRSF
jgi:hypothetical protein